MSLLRSEAVLVVEGGRRVAESYGRWHGPDRLVLWGSVTKVVLAATVRSLVDAGRCAWDDTAASVLSTDLPESATLRTLVAHTSGLPRLLPDQGRGFQDPYRPWTAERFDAALAALEVDRAATIAPEETYSNLGYAVLTRCVERLAGAPWLDVAREGVLAPAGIAADDVALDPPERAGRATNLLGRPLDEWDLSTGPYSGAGGLWATPRALVAVARHSLRDGSVLDPRSGPAGWASSPHGWWHDGGTLRAGACVTVDAARDRIVVAHALGGLPTGGAARAARLCAEAVEPVDPEEDA